MNARRTNSVVVFVILLLVGLAAPAAHGQPQTYDLRLDLEAGESYRFTTISDMEIAQQVMGQQVSYSMSTTLVLRYDVAEVREDGSMGVTVVFDRIAMEMEVAGESESFDSAEGSGSDSPLGEGVSALAGQRFRMEVLPTGEVKSVEGFEAIIDTAVSERDLSPEEAGQLRDQFGQKKMKDLMADAFGYARDGASVGESWERQIRRTNARFPLTANTTYTLRDVQDGTAVIDVASKISTPEDMKPVPSGSGEMDVELTGTQQGTMRVELATGLPQGSEMTSQMKGVGEMRARGQAVPIDMRVTTTVAYNMEAAE